MRHSHDVEEEADHHHHPPTTTTRGGEGSLSLHSREAEAVEGEEAESPFPTNRLPHASHTNAQYLLTFSWTLVFAHPQWKTNLAVSLSVRSPDSTISPQEHDLMTDKYAPRAFADYTANMSSTFQQVAPKGSYIGSPPRSRDKYIITREKMTFKPYALEYGRW